MRTAFSDSDSLPFSGVYPSPMISQINDYDLLGFEHFSNQAGKNNFLFQKQERVFDLDLNVDLFKYRVSDPVVGRFWSVDPVGDEYPYNSLYALQENKFGKGVELEGLELADFVHSLNSYIGGASAAIVDNNLLFPNNYRASQSQGKDPYLYAQGQKLGDALSLLQGGLEVLAGGASGALAVAGGGTAPAATVSVAAVAHGGAVMAKAAGSLTSRTLNSEGSGRGSNHLKPDPKAQGPHSTFRTNPKTGKTTNTATFEPNPKNPKTGFDEKKRVDVTGASHRNSKTGKEIKTPHTHLPKMKDPVPSTKNELPRQ